MHPCSAAVTGTIQAASRTINRRVNTPWRAVRVPHGREKNVGILCCDSQIRSSNVRPLIENLRPSPTAIGGFVNTALSVRCVSVTEGRDKHNFGVSRVDDYAADLLGVAQPDVAPGLATVG